MASGLSYMGARYYDASTGRFISEDPAFIGVGFDLADPQSLNSYAYARNNPLVFIDPDGRSYTPAQYFSAAGGYAVGFGQGVATFVVGTANAVVHPVQTFNNIGDSSAAAGRAFGTLIRDYRADPSGTMDRVSSAVSTAYAGFEGMSPYEQGKAIGNVFGQVDAGVAASGLVGKALQTSSGLPNDAHSSMNGLNLNKQLASEAQMGELMSGNGNVIAGSGSDHPIRVIDRIVRDYGGTAADWSKVSSSSHIAPDGMRFETHGYWNNQTSTLVEPKVKIKLP